jgi:hypothetical protein
VSSDHGVHPSSTATTHQKTSSNTLKKANDDAKLIFGTVFSLRNMTRKLGGEDDAFISYRTGQYKLHYYETPSNLRFAMLTEPGAPAMRNVLHQIYINLWVEYGKLSYFSSSFFLPQTAGLGDVEVTRVPSKHEIRQHVMM